MNAHDFVNAIVPSNENPLGEIAANADQLSKLEAQDKELKDKIWKLEQELDRAKRQKEFVEGYLGVLKSDPHIPFLWAVLRWLQPTAVQRKGHELLIHVSVCPCCMDRPAYVWNEDSLLWPPIIEAMRQMEISKITFIKSSGIMNREFHTGQKASPKVVYFPWNGTGDFVSKDMIKALPFNEPVMCLPLIPGVIEWQDLPGR